MDDWVFVASLIVGSAAVSTITYLIREHQRHKIHESRAQASRVMTDSLSRIFEQASRRPNTETSEQSYIEYSEHPQTPRGQTIEVQIAQRMQDGTLSESPPLHLVEGDHTVINQVLNVEGNITNSPYIFRGVVELIILNHSTIRIVVGSQPQPTHHVGIDPAVPEVSPVPPPKSRWQKIAESQEKK